jgi:hypothetical protein
VLQIDLRPEHGGGCGVGTQLPGWASGAADWHGLLFAAEDAPAIVRDRLALLSAGLGVALSELPIQIITTPTLRLDSDTDRQRLALTVAEHRPVLLILDPFVRLHRVDENVAGEVAPILDGLRQLQRALMAAPFSSSIMPARVQPISGPGRHCADPASFMPGATPTSSSGGNRMSDAGHRASAASAPDPIRLTLEASDRASDPAGREQSC